MRYALTHAHRCRPLLFHREYVARLLTFFDRWLVVLGACDGQEAADDGTAAILRDVARRHPARVRVEEAPHGWGSPLEAYRAALTTARQELDGEALLFLVPPGEVWELSQVVAAEQQLQARALEAALVPFDCYVAPEVLLRTGWQALPQPRLWRWRGQLPQRADPLTFPGLGPPQVVDVRPCAYPLLHSEQVRHHERRGPWPGLLERWVRLQAADPATFPRPLTDLLGPEGRIFTDAQLLHHDQPDPLPLP